MASSITRLLGRSRGYAGVGLVRQFIRSGGSQSDFTKTPPITPVSGPEWEDRGWKDDGLGLGDYPNLPRISAQDRDPYKKYWDQQERRNFGEPLHEEDDALSFWLYDSTDHNIFTPRRALAQLTVALGLLAGVIILGDWYDRPSRSPAAPKEYPYDNLYLEMGGDPDKDPSTQPKRRIPKLQVVY